MNRKTAKDLLPIIQAFAEGKDIEIRSKNPHAIILLVCEDRQCTGKPNHYISLYKIKYQEQQIYIV